jgi:hypothetical protein
MNGYKRLRGLAGMLSVVLMTLNIAPSALAYKRVSGGKSVRDARAGAHERAATYQPSGGGQ